jgi:hypothetical protein
MWALANWEPAGRQAALIYKGVRAGPLAKKRSSYG